MNFRIATADPITVVVATDEKPLLADVPSALELMATAQYEYGCSRIAVAKEAVAKDFFILSTRLAGEILQKFVTYRIKLAIFGDFSQYTSRPLLDFIRESNKGNSVFFVSSEEEAINRLRGA